ncbi:MAG: TfoX/Sxy family protein, partial [Acidimicrobiales bacterium]
KDLADRIRDGRRRDRSGGEGDVRALAFLVCGNMAVAASSEGRIMVRVDPAESDRLVDSGGAHVVEMRGRRMRGWAHVGSGQLASRTALAQWVGRSVSYARSLPPEDPAG